MILFVKDFIITGGENGVCYVWSMKRSNLDWEVENLIIIIINSFILKVTKVKELKEHNGPVKSLSSHPTNDWVSKIATIENVY